MVPEKISTVLHISTWQSIHTRVNSNKAKRIKYFRKMIRKILISQNIQIVCYICRFTFTTFTFQGRFHYV